MSDLTKFRPVFGVGNVRVLYDQNDSIPGYVKFDGTVYAQSTYPKLYEKLGVIPDSINNWVKRTGILGNVNQVAYLNDEYVYVASAGILATSTDGITWTQRSSTTISNIKSIAYSGTVYTICGNGTAFRTSTDLVTWTARTSGAQATFGLNWVSYGAGVFVAVGYNPSFQGHLITSDDDGVTWTVRTTGTTSTLWYSAYLNNLYIVGGDRVFATSTDAITWTVRTIQSIPRSVRWSNILYENGEYVAFDGTNPPTVYTSTDAITWTEKSNVTNGPGTVIPSGVQYDSTNSVWVAVTNVSLLSSTDLITWVTRTLGNTFGGSLVARSGTYVYASQLAALSTGGYISYDPTTSFYVPPIAAPSLVSGPYGAIATTGLYVKAEE